MKTPVFCNCTGHELPQPPYLRGGQNSRFKMTVTGAEEHQGLVREYTIVEQTIDAAAGEAIRMFVEEFQRDIQ